jgi:hypothetical protein
MTIDKAQEAYNKRMKIRCSNKKVPIKIYVAPEVKKKRALEIIGDIYTQDSIKSAVDKKFRQVNHKGA